MNQAITGDHLKNVAGILGIEYAALKAALHESEQAIRRQADKKLITLDDNDDYEENPF